MGSTSPKTTIKGFLFAREHLKRFLGETLEQIPQKCAKRAKRLLKSSRKTWIEEEEQGDATFPDKTTFFTLLTGLSERLEIEKITWNQYLAPLNPNASQKIHLKIDSLGVRLIPVKPLPEGNVFTQYEGKIIHSHLSFSKQT